MAREALFDKIIRSMDGNNPSVEFTDSEEIFKQRLLFTLELVLKHLEYTDYQIYKKVKKKFNTIGYPQVARDIMLVQRMIANDINPNADPRKTFVRFFVEEMAKKSIQIAIKKNDAYGIAYAANTIGRHNLTDREDQVKPKYEDIVPFLPEPTDDPTVLGIAPIENIELVRAKIEKKFDTTRRKFNNQFNKVEDVNEEKKDIL